MSLKHLEHLLQQVEKIPSEDINPNYLYGKQDAFAIVVDTPDGKTVVNHCSDIYNVVPNSQIINPIAEALKDYDVTITGSSKYNARFHFDVIFNDDKLMAYIGNKKDGITPRLRIQNSYDGRVKYSFLMGYYRLICTNGLMVAAEGTETLELKMRHTPALDEYVDPGEIVQMIETFIENGKDLIKPYKELAKKKVDSIEERVTQVIEKTRYPKRQTEAIVEVVEGEMKALGTKSANDWLVYNGMNNLLMNNDDIKMDMHKREKIDESVLSFLLK